MIDIHIDNPKGPEPMKHHILNMDYEKETETIKKKKKRKDKFLG